jgi:hypothetical protein
MKAAADDIVAMAAMLLTTLPRARRARVISRVFFIKDVSTFRSGAIYRLSRGCKLTSDGTRRDVGAYATGD